MVTYNVVIQFDIMPLIYISTVVDGSMKALQDSDTPTVRKNQIDFLHRHNINPNDTTFLRVEYDRSDYLQYMTLTNDQMGDGIIRNSSFISDAVVVTEPGHTLLLPLADCVGAVIHDPVKNILMLSHLGRHNLEQYGGKQSIRYLIENFQSDPNNITVWLSPAAGKEHYPLFAFANQSMHDVATEQLLSAGITPENISQSDIDTTKDATYFSHSEFLKGNRETDGRFAVVAVMR
jgi:hypothetical protein